MAGHRMVREILLATNKGQNFGGQADEQSFDYFIKTANVQVLNRKGIEFD